MEVRRLFDLLPYYKENHPDQDAALVSKKHGEWEKISITQYIEIANDVSYGLLKLGVEPGDKVAIIFSNCPEWNILDMAVMQMGGICVPIYPTISQDDYRFILNNAEIKLLFIQGKELKTKIQPILGEIPSLKWIYTLTDQGDYPFFEQLVELGKQNPVPERLQQIQSTISEFDLATLIYTSGTTGSPKGVMLSHSNIVNNFKNVANTPAKWNKRALSFLPLCHAYERMMVYLYHYLGISVYYVENLGKIADDIKEVNPTFMTCVPRFLEKIYTKLESSGRNLPAIQKNIYYWALNLAKKYKADDRTWWYEQRHKIADKLIYSQWRKAIGGNFDIVVSGGSSIQPQMAAFFSAIGMPVFEGYGLSETSPVIAVMTRDKGGHIYGTVGVKLPGTELKIGDNHEIMCRGHNVMMGYYKNPELTAEVIDRDGWFHTGDTGKLTDTGALIITGRLKNMFKTSFGKYINPDVIEAKMADSKFIENIVVFGENQKFAAALIVPDWDYVKNWCKKHEIPFTKLEEMVNNRDVIARIKKDIDRININFGDWERLKRFKLIPDEWSQRNNILTPTLKVKRSVIQQRYAQQIKNLFI